MAPSFSGVWKLQTKYQYNSAFPADPNLGAVGLYAGGVKTEGGTSYLAEVDKLLLAANGNATDFGDLSTNRGAFGTASSDTRMLTGGGFYNDAGGNDVQVNTIEYFTYATASNSTDYGDLTATKYLLNGLSNNVRGIFSGGSSSGSIINVIEFVTIATTGNATDFGDLTNTRSNHGYGICASTTRGIITDFNTNVIEYITIASAGNSADFGDMTVTRKQGHAQMASATRGVFGGGRDNSNNASNIIDYITIASTGNATDFGDLAAAKYATMGMSSLTKGFIAGGYASSYENVIEQITIATTGNATDFGDLTRAKGLGNGASNGQAAFQLEADFPPAALGLFPGGYGSANAPIQRNIDFINIASTGNSSLFGEIRFGQRYAHGGGASTTRGIFAGGFNHANSYSGYKTIEYISLQSKGATQDFGDMTDNRFQATTLSNSTRALIAQGVTTNLSSAVNSIDKLTIASLGNATDFGDATIVAQDPNSVASTTRGIIAGGINNVGGASEKNTIAYVTIASDGDASDFGDLTVARYGLGNGGNSTRGLFAGGNGGGTVNTIDYITIASTGNATDFGDLNVTREYFSGASSSTRAVFGNGSDSNKGMDFVTIASTGNASDFGDLIGDYGEAQALSNSHGGIS